MVGFNENAHYKKDLVTMPEPLAPKQTESEYVHMDTPITNTQSMQDTNTRGKY